MCFFYRLITFYTGCMLCLWTPQALLINVFIWLDWGFPFLLLSLPHFTNDFELNTSVYVYQYMNFYSTIAICSKKNETIWRMTSNETFRLFVWCAVNWKKHMNQSLSFIYCACGRFWTQNKRNENKTAFISISIFILWARKYDVIDLISTTKF